MWQCKIAQTCSLACSSSAVGRSFSRLAPRHPSPSYASRYASSTLQHTSRSEPQIQDMHRDLTVLSDKHGQFLTARGMKLQGRPVCRRECAADSEVADPAPNPQACLQHLVNIESVLTAVRRCYRRTTGYNAVCPACCRRHECMANERGT